MSGLISNTSSLVSMETAQILLPTSMACCSAQPMQMFSFPTTPAPVHFRTQENQNATRPPHATDKTYCRYICKMRLTAEQSTLEWTDGIFCGVGHPLILSYKTSKTPVDNNSDTSIDITSPG